MASGIVFLHRRHDYLRYSQYGWFSSHGKKPCNDVGVFRVRSLGVRICAPSLWALISVNLLRGLIIDVSVEKFSRPITYESLTPVPLSFFLPLAH